ncbi:flavodoxin [Paenibacillus athensensis]|uniref:Flavodoxin n=1 Tax=Paenibacillus athensensis TaxID=1967502 RepID=A0A4Y8Q378_9BACL|nr:flavodoxin [Paenibacillus athensensis]MCD1261061.1 flavodoxin [Paenibacillus athensensis]
MAKVIMVYASSTGNTKKIAKLIGKALEQAGVDLTVRELPQATPSELEQYDGIILGSYTYGDGDLADEFLDYYEDMDGLDLTGKIAAVFGSGDTSYDNFCGAVDTLSAKLTELGAIIIQEDLKIELGPDDEEVCLQFGREFAESLFEVFQEA